MKKEKRRFLLIISIFALISYLVCFLVGLAYGLAVDNRTAVDQWGADQIVIAKGSNNNISSSMIDEKQFFNDLEGIDYEFVNLSRSAAYINGVVDEESTINVALLGLRTDSEKFPKIIEGEEIKESMDAIASLSLKEEEGIKLGDELKLSMNESAFRIVGFTNDYKFNVSPVIYTSLDEASISTLVYKNWEKGEGGKMPPGMDAEIPKRVSAALIYTKDDISSLSDSYDVVPMTKFINEIPGYYAQLLTFGLMKIQGISNGYIGNSVVIQTFLISFIGLSTGLILTVITDFFLPSAVPVRSNIMFLSVISAIMMVTAQIGAIFSVKSVSKVDPLEVI